MPALALTPKLFDQIQADVSDFICKRLVFMEVDFTDVELHNSVHTKTFRVYVTIKRTTNLKALALIEKGLCDEIEQTFSFHPHAFYWRYKAEAEPAVPAAPPKS